MKVLKKSLLIICSFLLLFSNVTFAQTTINYTVSEKDRIITVKGTITKQDSQPVAHIMAVNKSVDSNLDRRKGIRYTNTQTCKNDNSFEFSFFAIDGGEYEIKITDDNGECLETKSITLDKSLVSMSGGGVVGKNANAILQLSQLTGAKNGSFSITYNPSELSITNANAVKGNEKVSLSNIVLKNNNISGIYTISAQSHELAYIQMMFEVSSALQNNSCNVIISDFKMLDRFGTPIGIDFQINNSISLVSADEFADAILQTNLALKAIPTLQTLNENNYVNTLSFVTEADKLILMAIELGAVVEEDFDKALVDNLAKIKEKLAEMKPDMDILISLNNASSNEYYKIVKNNNSQFNISKKTLEWLDKLDNKDTILSKLSQTDIWEANDLKTSFEQAVILIGLEVTTWGSVESFLKDLNWENGLDFEGAYKNLTQDQKIFVQKALSKKPCNSLVDLINAFNTAVTEAKNTKPASNISTQISNDVGSKQSVSVNGLPPVIPDKPKTEFVYLDGFDWAQESILALSDKDIISGDGNGCFRPNDNITRAEFVKILMMAMDLTDITATCSFSDVNLGDWHYPYISTANNLGIVNGVNASEFGANEKITRQDIAVIMVRCMKSLNIQTKNSDGNFRDFGSISDYAKESVNIVYNSGIMGGVGEKMFMPFEKANRAMAAKVIYFLSKLR